MGFSPAEYIQFRSSDSVLVEAGKQIPNYILRFALNDVATSASASH